ncbi:MAG: type II secretion system F family protein [Rhizomicrobium sp.]
MDIIDILLNNEALVTLLAAVLAFSTIVTLGLPMLKDDQLAKRMAAVTEQRQELRVHRMEALEGRRFALHPEQTASTKWVTRFVSRFNLARLAESDDVRGKLMRAGLRGATPHSVFIFFRFIMPIILFLLALIYLFGVTDFSWGWLFKLAVSIAAALAGYYLPDVFVANLTTKRREAIMIGFPDALDLLLICVESGMSAEMAFEKVASEIGRTSPVLAEEFSLTTAELSYLPERRQAFDNLAARCGYDGVQAVVTALTQAEKYGTTLGQALRVCARENREMRMARAEKKAAALPAKLTVPMILFFLPCLFVVIMGPAIMKIMHLV